MLNRFISSFLKTFFKLLYHQFAWTYDWIADIVSIGRWKNWVYSVIPYLGENRVLELGCGPGHLQVAYSIDNGMIFGLDTSQQMLRQARRNLSKHDQINKLVLGNAQDLPYRDNSFPVVVSTFPTDYIFDPNTLKQVWRVLQNDGQLIILLAAWITGSHILDRFGSWLFTITGESPQLDGSDLEGKFEQHFEKLSQVGFLVDHEIIESDRSQVLLIRAVKKST